VELCQAERGTSAVCIREAQKTLAQSSKRLIESKIAGLGLGHRFKIFSDKIATPGDGVIIFQGRDYRDCHRICRGDMARRQGHAGQMMRTLLIVAALLAPSPAPFPAGWSRKPLNSMARWPRNPGRGPKAFPRRKSRRRDGACDSPDNAALQFRSRRNDAVQISRRRCLGLGLYPIGWRC
jgi:hypothetical protein